jgi:hypothetical protein
MRLCLKRAQFRPLGDDRGLAKPFDGFECVLHVHRVFKDRYPYPALRDYVSHCQVFSPATGDL